MAKFLNTQGLSEWIPRIINETKRELVIITPFMQLSEKIYESLVKANERGVETIIVYREKKLSEEDRNKLSAIDNLNLFHHPTLHTKCYYNEKYLLIASMNLYEYSEKNNREMGVLMHNVNLDNPNEYYDGDDQIFKEALSEIKSIIKSSEFEKKSRETLEEGFEMDILKTERELKEEYCKKINKIFIHKQFEPYLVNDIYQVRCFNYFDNIDIDIDYRITLHFNYEEHHLEKIHKQFLRMYNEFMFNGFKFYWNYYGRGKAFLYKDTRNAMWNVEEKECYQIMQEGISQFMQLLKPMIIQK